MVDFNDVTIMLDKFSLRHAYFMYLDKAPQYFADKEFIKKKLPVHFYKEFTHPDTKYNVIVCRIKKNHIDDFKIAICEFIKNMSIYGYTDYVNEAKEFINHIKTEDGKYIYYT